MIIIRGKSDLRRAGIIAALVYKKSTGGQKKQGVSDI